MLENSSRAIDCTKVEVGLSTLELTYVYAPLFSLYIQGGHDVAEMALRLRMVRQERRLIKNNSRRNAWHFWWQGIYSQHRMVGKMQRKLVLLNTHFSMVFVNYMRKKKAWTPALLLLGLLSKPGLCWVPILTSLVLMLQSFCIME